MPQRQPRHDGTRRTLLALLVLLLVPVLSSVSPISPAAGAPATASGVYSGPGYVAQHDAFATWVPAQVPYAIDFLESRYGWTEMLHPWALDAWAPWVKASPGRRLVLSVPMLPAGAKGQLSAGAAGSFDPYFRSLAQNMVARGLGTSIVRVGWEANGSWHPWSAVPDPAAWKLFYRRIVATMRATPGAAFTFDWTANPGTSLSLSSFYPGDDVVDVIGLDVYDMKWQDTTATPEQRWSFLLNQFNGLIAHRDFAAAHGKPLSFPEWGLYITGDAQGGGGDNPYYIDRMADWFASTNTAYQAYFKWGTSDLGRFPKGMIRYQARFADTGTTTTTQATSTSTTAATNATTTTTTVKRACVRKACR